MDKSINEISHNLTMVDRKNINLTGIKRIISFDDKEFYVESVMGSIVIKGQNLELLKLDTFQKLLSIKGLIISIVYLDGVNKKNKSEMIISRLFK